MTDAPSSNHVAVEIRHLREASVEIERLTAELEAVQRVYAVERKCAAVRADRLRAALEHIIYYETHDMDGNTMPESGAAFIAKEALRGADTSSERRPYSRDEILRRIKGERFSVRRVFFDLLELCSKQKPDGTAYGFGIKWPDALSIITPEEWDQSYSQAMAWKAAQRAPDEPSA